MDVLLDTHALLWFMDNPEKLSKRAYEAIVDEDNRVFISMVSIWEIQIKSQLSKITLDEPLPSLIREQQTTNGMRILAIEAEHIYTLNIFENHHRDPFDRLLMAQSKVENCPLITCDTDIRRYSETVTLLW